MLLCKLLFRSEELQAPQRKAFALKSTNNFSNQASLYTIWLYLRGTEAAVKE